MRKTGTSTSPQRSDGGQRGQSDEPSLNGIGAMDEKW
ncbi:hypothetical protein EG68_09091 [Paragonimus skrjabini miyazakii]|uniref:Uncharacterized protein n=1 Tax=Paragonimus skrjabini miyazakii TaxID=59628 RepID=A0A8S9YID2_9TREM|nr:hypothetical protein EG68_09091 [Paragonimus skrjabini miyazakii]